MVEARINGIKPREFIEVDASCTIRMEIIFASDKKEDEKREGNRRRVEEGRKFGMVSPMTTSETLAITTNVLDGGRRRRSNGGRHLKPREKT